MNMHNYGMAEAAAVHVCRPESTARPRDTQAHVGCIARAAHDQHAPLQHEPPSLDRSSVTADANAAQAHQEAEEGAEDVGQLALGDVGG